MEVVLKDDDLGLVLFNSLDQISPFAHGLDRRLNSFGTSIHGEYHFFSGHIREFFCKEGPLIVEECPGSERKDISLILESLDDLRMPVSLVHSRICRKHVHVPASLGIFDPDPFSLGNDDFQGMIVMGAEFMLHFHKLL